ncbi:FAD-binding protein [bacterium]|nr:FAD-binding protein [bacterium]
MNSSISRRTFAAGIAVAGVASAGIANQALAMSSAKTDGTKKSSAAAESSTKSTVSKAGVYLPGGDVRNADGQAAWDEQPASVADKVASTESFDVVVVGGGNAGVIGALEAAQLGAKVVVLEQSDANTMWAGDIDACDSQLQKEAGVEADKEYVIHDLVRYASGKCDENLIRLWAYNAGAFVDWYQEQLQSKGLDVMVDTIKKRFYPENFYFTNTYHTAYQPPLQPTDNHMGSEVAMPALLELFAEAGGTMTYHAKVVELVQPDGPGTAVTGVIAQMEDGTYTQYDAAKGVLLACGGFLGNKDMMDQLGVVSHKYCSNHVGGEGRNGDGIKLAHWAGAAMDDSFAGSMLIFDRGCITSGGDGDLGGQGGGNPAFWWPGSQPFLFVNQKGQRFCNEDEPYDFKFNLVAQQPGHYAWQIFDDTSWDDVVSFGTTICSRLVAQEGAKNCNLLGQFHPCVDEADWRATYIDPNVKNGNLIKCDTLEELAEAMGMDENATKNFLETVERYNELASKGVDEDHGKAPWRLSNIDQPPYYAAKMAGWALATLGGIRVNADMQAITADGEPIPGLYIGGLDSGNFFNGNYPQLYGGLCMSHAISFAWLAARSMMGEEYPVPMASCHAAYANC